MNSKRVNFTKHYFQWGYQNLMFDFYTLNIKFTLTVKPFDVIT